ncbi:hypothetical protein MNBD_GAMMA09-3379 [hydrothermal vent metagenome]|uniref:Thymidine phosphorylase n=1 Tax=hydrothermal vent metagenome TaxID=652676 RepID=A0A3B0X588_9ZZZZ
MSADNNAFDNTLKMDTKKIQDKEYVSKVISDYVRNQSADTNALQSSASGKNYFNRDDVLKALNNIQLTYKTHYVAGQQVNINTDTFKTTLLNSMAKLNNVAAPKSMNQIDGRTIDFVEMIFGAFLRDPNISDAVKSLLLRLQIPVIKTSLIDHNFFYDNKHSARKLLDTIAHLGIGIEEEKNTVYQTINLVVDQLLRSFDKNTVSFRTALSSLQRLTTIEHKKLRQNEDVTRKQFIQEHARQLVLSELQYHTMEVKLPRPVQPLLLNNWSTYMFSCYLKFGKSSYEWQESIDILKIITKSLMPINNQEGWNSLKNNYHEIVNTVRTKLELTKQSKERIFMATANLSKHYEKAIKDSEFFEADAIEKERNKQLKDSIYADKSNDSLSPVEKQAKSAQSLIAELPAFVKPGVWFKIFTAEDMPPRRLKLSIIAQENAKLVFVDRKGSIVIEKEAETFTKELLNNQSQMLEDHSVFDHALSQVISHISSSHK